MADQATDQSEITKNRIGEIAGKAFLWSSFGLALVTIEKTLFVTCIGDSVVVDSRHVIFPFL